MRHDTGPQEAVEAAYAAIEADRARDPAVWIDLVDIDEARRRALEVAAADDDAPLRGVPFAVKDNFDVAGRPTTAACPAFANIPDATAPAVRRLVDAGAILVGKTNMDQFATGLVGTRSPHGAPRCVASPAHISGGSSSGSAVAVAAGLVPIALGTDTAGSGRVPAALNGIVGLKPTRGLVSTRGVVPASRSLDCVSVFARTIADAARTLAVLEWPDPEDPYARARPFPSRGPAGRARIGVPVLDRDDFFGDDAAAECHAAALARLADHGELVEVDAAPFLAAGDLLYGGALIAERLVAFGDFARAHPSALDPTVHEIIDRARVLGAEAYAADLQRLAELRRLSAHTWAVADVIALPTTGTTYTVAQIHDAPIARNANLGRFTNFVNLLDLCAVSVPAGVRRDGLPAGLSLIAPAFAEPAVLGLGAALLGEDAPDLVGPPGHVSLAVVGAHLAGQPLNHQLTERGAFLVTTTTTAPEYRLYALAGTTPPKPGLVRDATGGPIEVEVWAIDTAGFGAFTAEVPAPLAIGTVRLADGSEVKGFVCEPAALAGARDITSFGGWRAYLGAG